MRRGREGSRLAVAEAFPVGAGDCGGRLGAAGSRRGLWRASRHGEGEGAEAGAPQGLRPRAAEREAEGPGGAGRFWGDSAGLRAPFPAWGEGRTWGGRGGIGPRGARAAGRVFPGQKGGPRRPRPPRGVMPGPARVSAAAASRLRPSARSGLALLPYFRPQARPT